MTDMRISDETRRLAARLMPLLDVGTLRSAAPALLCYLLLVDAAIETFARRSPVRWWVSAGTALYLGGTAELRRRRHPLLQRLGWPRTAGTSSFVLFGLIVLTAWLPGGLQNGVRVLGVPTSTLLSFISAAAVAWAAVLAVRLDYRHPAMKWAVVAAAAYGVMAFLRGMVAGTPYGALFRGESFWSGLPAPWLQGAYMGALVLALAVVVSGLRLLRPVETERSGLQQIAALAMALVIVVAGIRTARRNVAEYPVPDTSATRDSATRGAVAAYPVLDQFAPKSPTATINAVSLSSPEPDGNGFDPSKVGTQFGDKVQRVIVWYRWEGAENGRRVDIQWAKDGELVLEQWEVLQEPSGNASWYLEREAAAGPLPAGRYQVTLVENGTRVTEIPFQIAGR